MLRVAREARMARIGDSRKILSPAASFSAADSKLNIIHIFSPTCKKSLSRRFCPSYFPILTLHSCISVMLKWSAYFYWLAMSSVNACIFLYIQICFSVIWLTRRRSVNKYFHILWHLNLFSAQFCMIVLYLWILITAVNFRLRVKRFRKEKVSIFFLSWKVHSLLLSLNAAAMLRNLCICRGLALHSPSLRPLEKNDLNEKQTTEKMTNKEMAKPKEEN